MKEEELEDVKVDDFYSEKLKELYTKGGTDSNIFELMIVGWDFCIQSDLDQESLQSVLPSYLNPWTLCSFIH